jgi:hypothetical protein
MRRWKGVSHLSTMRYIPFTPVKSLDQRQQRIGGDGWKAEFC